MFLMLTESSLKSRHGLQGSWDLAPTTSPTSSQITPPPQHLIILQQHWDHSALQALWILPCSSLWLLLFPNWISHCSSGFCLISHVEELLIILCKVSPSLNYFRPHYLIFPYIQTPHVDRFTCSLFVFFPKIWGLREGRTLVGLDTAIADPLVPAQCLTMVDAH